MTDDKYGVVHGRFQPLHNGHVHYILEGLDKCETLVIGITNSDPTQVKLENSDLQRHLPSYNPFTFFERLQMVRATLEKERRISPDRFFVVPLPIHNMKLWKYYLPDNAIHYLVVTTDWDEIKFQRISSEGYQVKVIGRTRFMGITGTEVRRRIIEGNDWKSLVPLSVAKIISDVNGVERFKSLREKDKTQNSNYSSLSGI